MNTNSLNEKPLLVPVKVPWQIDAATPHLRLMASESGGERTQVTAYARFLVQSFPDKANTASVVKVYPPKFDAAGRALGDQSGQYRVVRCFFKSAARAQIGPSFSDLEVVDRTAYDWSEIPILSKPDEGVEASVRHFCDAWRASTLCPNPRMYEIKGSAWLKELGKHADGYTHYLILGHDAYIEVLAEGWRWEIVPSAENGREV
jgi:hypothetical protein